jgi:PAS domain S-box-containing protein
MNLLSRHTLRYALAILIALVALTVAWAFPLFHAVESPLLFLLTAVVVSTWLLGWKAGLLTTVLCAAGHVSALIYSVPDYFGESIQLAVFLLLSLLVLGLSVMRQDAEESLIDSETQLRSILENSLDPIGVSCAGIHRFVNPAYVRMFGYRQAADLIGQSVLQIIAPDERASIRDRIERRSRGEQVESSYETRGLRADGLPIDMEVHVSSYQLAGERYSLVIIRDVTERKRLFREKEMLIGELRDALAKVKTLSGLLPTCAGCRKIRDDAGEWQDMETYISEHSEAGFSHGLCPACAERLYPEVFGPPGISTRAWSP